MAIRQMGLTNIAFSDSLYTRKKREQHGREICSSYKASGKKEDEEEEEDVVGVSNGEEEVVLSGSLV